MKELSYTADSGGDSSYAENRVTDAMTDIDISTVGLFDMWFYHGHKRHSENKQNNSCKTFVIIFFIKICPSSNIDRNILDAEICSKKSLYIYFVFFLTGLYTWLSYIIHCALLSRNAFI